MILNYLSNYKINNLLISDFYNYLSYLNDIGLSHEFVSVFETLYTEKDNKNFYEYLDELNYFDINKANYKVYKYIKEKNK